MAALGPTPPVCPPQPRGRDSGEVARIRVSGRVVPPGIDAPTPSRIRTLPVDVDVRGAELAPETLRHLVDRGVFGTSTYQASVPAAVWSGQSGNVATAGGSSHRSGDVSTASGRTTVRLPGPSRCWAPPEARAAEIGMLPLRGADWVAGHDDQRFIDPPAAGDIAPVDRPKRAHRGENRIPPAAAVLVAIVLYAVLPEPLLLGPRFLIPGLELALLAVLIATNPLRMTRQTRWSRAVALITAALVVTSNLVALALLVVSLVSSADTPGPSLLVAALQVWATNVIAFGLIFWELDRGGPVVRTQQPRDRLPLADFRFTQDETQDTVIEVAAGSSKKSDWIPTFVDYMYLSTTNSSAFSPTDTMPLTSRAKILMAIQATGALITSLLVIARAVGALGGG